jgi:hypothetical protein
VPRPYDLTSSPKSCRRRGTWCRARPRIRALEGPHPENSTYRSKIIPPPSK